MKIASILFALLLGACASAPQREPLRPTPNGQRQLGVLMSYMSGTYDSIDQDKGPGKGVRMRIAQFWPELQKEGEYWVYVEHAKVGQEDKPFSQRIYRYVESGGKFWAESYPLPGKPEAFVNEWRKPQPFAGYKPAQLTENVDCRLMVGQMTIMFWVRTEGKACRTGDPKVAHEYTSLLANSAGMREGTQAYDAAGKLVAGEADVWEFKRMSREAQ